MAHTPNIFISVLDWDLWQKDHKSTPAHLHSGTKLMSGRLEYVQSCGRERRVHGKPQAGFLNLLPGSDGCYFCSFHWPGQILWPNLMSLKRTNIFSKGGAVNIYEPHTVRQVTSGVGRAPLSVENLHSFLYLLPHRKIAAHSGFLKTLSTRFSKDCDVCMFRLHLTLYSALPRLPSHPHSPSPRKRKQSKTRQKTEL